MFMRLIVAIPDSAAKVFQPERTHADGWPAQLSRDILTPFVPPHYIELEYIFTSDVLRISNREEPTEQILRKRWIKLGWSEAKIVRALDDMRKSHSQRFHGLRDDLRSRIVSAARSAGPVFLFAYDASDEPIVEDRIRVTADDILNDSSLVQLNLLVEVTDHDGTAECRHG